jgi:hypothetical protein
MKYLLQIFVCVLVMATPTQAPSADGESELHKKIAELSEFEAKVDELGHINFDVVSSGALSLLAIGNDDWELSKVNKHWVDGEERGYSSDVAAVSADYGHDLHLLRGSLVRNSAVTEDQREEALEVFELVRELLAAADQLGKLEEAGKPEAAGEHYRQSILPLGDEIKRKASSLGAEMNQAIKFMAL